MLEWLSDLTVFRVTGLIGVFFGLLGVILPGIVYRGKDGEKYSFLNHFISELDEGDTISDGVEKALLNGIDFVRAVHVHFHSKAGTQA